MPQARAEKPLSFGVISQRSAVLTAEYWNPILAYLSRKSGVPLALKLGGSGPETSQRVGRGEFDVVYSNHIFTVDNDKVGYRVIARPLGSAIRGQIVVLEDSPVARLADLDGKTVAFPHNQAFVAYYVTQDALLRARVQVVPSFGGNQEGAMAQLKSGRAPAASVNSRIMSEYAEREGLRYRVLWSSAEFLNIPVAVHPRVRREQAQALQAALVGMAADEEGARVLAAAAALVQEKPPYGFVKVTDEEYESVRHFYRASLVRPD